MSRKRPRATSGFTLYEIVVALLLLGIALHPLLSTLSSDTRIATDRQLRQDAERVLRNEVARISAAAPGAVPAEHGYRADRSGRLAPDGAFAVRARRSTRCGIGGAVRDNADAPPIAGCASGGAVADYIVSVTYPRAAASADSGTVTHAFAVAGNSPRGGNPGGLP